jgi:hypothetical protein
VVTLFVRYVIFVSFGIVLKRKKLTVYGLVLVCASRPADSARHPLLYYFFLFLAISREKVFEVSVPVGFVILLFNSQYLSLAGMVFFSLIECAELNL